ncbi:thioesterase family protein [Rarobacter faecitabidus]|uniref:Acyl-CoA thioesterase-2 n=1 Tax=Rarobacter faecitabidus TaxID=13243 RepID=A0A542ZWS2_RARFA|nr:acyl-CoA thioesterase domain-containing protein [Rarobacter faecitabidus]TQL64749.1 acyl-CoA thioesterase-2 [Rarobacter faecitabidus]
MTSPGDTHRPTVQDEPSRPLEQLWQVLNLVPTLASDGRHADSSVFAGTSLHQPTGRVYGGQVLAQSLLAAGATVVPERLPHSIHGYFMRPGVVEKPLLFGVEKLRDGKSFSARRTHAYQEGEPILSMITSFQLQQPGLEFAVPAPQVPGPDELPTATEHLAGIDHPAAAFWGTDSPFDIRHVDAPLFLRPDPRKVPHQHVWLRSKGRVEASQLEHRAALAYACDQLILEPVMRGSGICWITPGLNLASIDHAMWWHRDVRIDEWLLFELSAISASGGRGLSTARVFAADGTLVATINQEGMLRVP